MLKPDSFFERTVFLCGVLAAFLLTAPSGSYADYLMVFKGRDAISDPNMENGVEYYRVWVSKSSVNLEIPKDGLSMIVRVDTKKVYLMSNSRKVYFEADYPFNFKGDPIGDKLKDCRIELKDTGKMMKILGMDAKRYHHTITLNNGHAYSETDIWKIEKVPEELLLYEIMSDETTALDPWPKFFTQSISRLPGFTAKTVATEFGDGTKAVGFKEVMEIQKKDPPPGIYEVPKGYVSVPLGKE